MLRVKVSPAWEPSGRGDILGKMAVGAGRVRENSRQEEPAGQLQKSLPVRARDTFELLPQQLA